MGEPATDPAEGASLAGAVVASTATDPVVRVRGATSRDKVEVEVVLLAVVAAPRSAMPKAITYNTASQGWTA